MTQESIIGNPGMPHIPRWLSKDIKNLSGNWFDFVEQAVDKQILNEMYGELMVR